MIGRIFAFILASTCLFLTGCAFLLSPFYRPDSPSDSQSTQTAEASRCVGNACADVADQPQPGVDTHQCPQCWQFINHGSQTVRLEWDVAALGLGSPCGKAFVTLKPNGDTFNHIQTYCLPLKANYTTANAINRNRPKARLMVANFVTAGSISDSVPSFITGITAFPMIVGPSQTTTLQISLANAAPQGGATIALQMLAADGSANSRADIPSSVTVPANQTFISVPVTIKQNAKSGQLTFVSETQTSIASASVTIR